MISICRRGNFLIFETMTLDSAILYFLLQKFLMTELNARQTEIQNLVVEELRLFEINGEKVKLGWEAVTGVTIEADSEALIKDLEQKLQPRLASLENEVTRIMQKFPQQ